MDSNLPRNTKRIPSILITVDYELFGNGAGDIRTHVLEPAEELIAFLAEFNIPCTFFIETAEILSFERAIQTGRGDEALKRDFEAILEQIERMVLLGHDVQLHYHPQWSHAEPSTGRWELTSKHGSLLQYGPERLREELLAGKRFLETIGRAADPEYACQIFRAGAFHFDRLDILGTILLDCGMLADSSMVRGYTRQTEYATIDNRDLLSIQRPYWWTLSGAPRFEHRGSLLEIPVWSFYQPNWHKLNSARLTTKLFLNQSSVGFSEMYGRAGAPKNPFKLLTWLMGKQAILWDFTLMSGRQLIHSCEKALSYHQPMEYLPLVMIGHTKELRGLKALQRFIQYVSNIYEPTWATMSNAVGVIQSLESRCDSK